MTCSIVRQGEDVHMGSFFQRKSKISGRPWTTVTPLSGHQRRLCLSRIVVHVGLQKKAQSVSEVVWLTVSGWPMGSSWDPALSGFCWGLGAGHSSRLPVLPRDDHSPQALEPLHIPLPPLPLPSSWKPGKSRRKVCFPHHFSQDIGLSPTILSLSPPLQKSSFPFSFVLGKPLLDHFSGDSDGAKARKMEARIPGNLHITPKRAS